MRSAGYMYRDVRSGESNLLGSVIAGISLFIMSLIFMLTYDMLTVVHDTITKPVERKIAGRGETANEELWSLILTTVDGRKVSMSSLKNRILIFWLTATWCEECIATGRYIADLIDKYSDLDISVIVVGVWTAEDVKENIGKGIVGVYPPDSSVKLSKYIKRLGGYTWYGVMDYGKELRRILGVYEINSFVVIGRDGEIMYRGKGIDDLVVFEYLILKNIDKLR